MCSVLALLVLHCGLQGAVAFRAPLARRPLTARHATGEEDLARLREEIAELEKDLQIKKPPPPVDAPKPERRRPAGGAAIVDGRVRVDSVVAKLDAALLPAGVDADDEKSKFAEFCLFDAMTGEGLKHVELGGLRAVTVDGSEELILLLSGLEDVSPGDDVSVSELKAETDKFVATLSKYAGEGDADAVWEKVGAAYEDDGSDGGDDGDDVVDGDGDEVFGIDLSDAATLTPQVLSYRVGERFAESAADHWRDWCAVATAREARRGPSGELLTTGEAALYGAALEKLRGRIDFDAVSSAAFAAEVAANATSNDETFAQSVGLFEFAFRAALKRAAAVPPGDRTAADLEAVWTRAAQEGEITNVKGSDLGHFPLVSADFWTSDRLSERSRSVGAVSGTRARETLTVKRR